MTDPDGAMARTAAAHWRGADPEPIAMRENVVFAMTLPEGRAALRLHRRGYQSEEAIRSELWWMRALHDAGLAVPRPLETRDGRPFVRLDDGRVASAVEWVAGAPLGAGGRPSCGPAPERTRRYRGLGRLLAEIHGATDAMTLPPGFRRPSWDVAGLVGEAPFWGRFWEHPALSAAEARLLAAARHDLREILDEHARDGADRGLIHADVLGENVLCDGDGDLSLIDFDDCGYGFRLYDLGTVLSQHVDGPQFHEIRAALLEGYHMVRPLGASARRMVDAFTVMRTLASVGWTAPRLDARDPRHRAYIARAVAATGSLMPQGRRR